MSPAAVSSPSLHANLPVVERALPKFAAESRTPPPPPRQATARKPKRAPKRSAETVSSSGVKPIPGSGAPVEDPEHEDLKNPFASR